MKDKIKCLSMGYQKPKLDNIKSWEGAVERYAPDMYEFFYSTGEKETISQINKLQPEIIMMNPSNHKLLDSLGLLIKIKQLHPTAAVFVNLNIVDDEQEVVEEFMARGAYKCYLPPFFFDTLIHDMYVALNLE